MTEMRDALACDRQELAALWAETFGDPEALASSFLALLPELGFGLAAVEDGKLRGAAYWIDALRLGERRCGYLYAVAVKAAARGRGLGAALSRGCLEKGRARGAAFCCTEPAEPSLFAWYARLGLRPALCSRSRTFAPAPGLPVSPLSAAAYGERREALLAEAPHVVLLPPALRFEEALLRTYGGGFFAVGEGIAAVERDGETVALREALGADPARIAASLAAVLGCQRASLRETAEEGEPLLAADTPFPAGTSWNLTFD